jgi:gamma-glutamylcyclotransferase
MPDTFFYFAFGSNMLARRLRARTPSAVVRGTGFIGGHRLTFDKISTHGSGKCRIEATTNPGGRVYGVLFAIASAEAENLDREEGVGNGYRKDFVNVVTVTEVITAVAYIADRRNSNLRPYDWYKAFVVHGAIDNHLPTAYVRFLRAIESNPDPDQKRCAKNEAVLRGE